MFLNVFGFCDLSFPEIVAVKIRALGGLYVRPAAALRTDGEAGQQLIQFLTLAGWANDHSRGEHKQFEFLRTATTPIFVNRH
jgi:hypothetical protein